MHSHPPQLRPQKDNGASTHSGRAVGRGSLRSFGVAIVVGSGPRSLGAAICRPPRLAPLRSARRAAPVAAPSPLLPPHLSPFSPLSLSGAPLVRRGLPRPRTPAPPFGRGCALWRSSRQGLRAPSGWVSGFGAPAPDTHPLSALSPPPLLQKRCPLGAGLCPRYAPASPSLRSG